MFASERIQSTFEAARDQFLTATFESTVAHHVLQRLQTSAPAYAEASTRNDLVRQLAADVEADLGVPANLMFRTSGYLHDCLQDFLDVYLNCVDGVYYPDIAHHA